jgi:hypothetical protein
MANSLNLQHGILQECFDRISEKMRDAVKDGEVYAAVTVNTECGWIDISTDEHDTVDVRVVHENNEEKDSPNITDALFNLVPYWCDIEDEVNSEDDEEDECEYYDEWNEHGFASEADYYQWRYG